MKVKFLPQNVEFEIKPGQSVLHLAQDHQIHIRSVCRGVPSCAECRVRVVDGEGNVIPPSSAELSLIGTAWFVDQRRLSCQLRCFGDVTVDVSGHDEKDNLGKKPRGRYNKDELQESRAILGNLVMSDKASETGLFQGLESSETTSQEAETQQAEATDANEGPPQEGQSSGPSGHGDSKGRRQGHRRNRRRRRP